MSAQTVTIEALGARGDGVARTEAGPIHVAFTLPGETVTVAREGTRGTLMALKETASGRVDPPCPHFGPDAADGPCGGCNLQHLALPAYADWKRMLVVQALALEGLAPDVAPLFRCAPVSRRRLTMTARRTEAGLLLGFNRAGSHHIVDIQTCVIAERRIVQHLAAIRRVASAVTTGSKPFRLTVLASDTGLDIAVMDAGRLSPRQREIAIETVLAEPVVARLAVDGEVVVAVREPRLGFGEVSVTPPPGGFVQASAAAERHMAALVSDHLAGARRVADLFSGCGTFALRLAAHSAVTAVESEPAALAALDAAARRAPGLKPVKTERRDLFRRPMMARDLRDFGGVVFDPPRAGAQAQSRELAASDVKRIAAVSCNPTTLARDLRLLVEGGYRIERVHPVDQFLWSPHCEVVALLARD